MKKGSPMEQLHWRRIGLGAALAMLTTLVLTGALAALMEREVLAVEWSRYLAVAVLLASGFAAGASALGGGTVMETGLSAALYWLMLLGVNAGLYQGSRGGLGVTLLAILGGWGSSLLLFRLGAGSGRRRSRKRRRR